MSAIVANPADYGIALPVVRNVDPLRVLDLAAANGLSSQQLKSFNNLNSDLLQIGKSLRFPSTRSFSPPHVFGTKSYTVRQGDSLWTLRGKVINPSIGSLA